MNIGVLTSGGDAQGMNAALRAVVRTGLKRGISVYAIAEGYQGLVDGGAGIRPLGWYDVGGILHRGGTVIGTARSLEFRERTGRQRAVRNLIERGIDRLVVIGGDGSLTGADAFRREWAEHVAELQVSGAITAEQAERHPSLGIVGLVGSIDNDFCGTDMTIGADSALHRIVEAIDALASTAASHQRTFVVEVMGRHCGYLALMGAVAGAADYAIIPEQPPEPGWEQAMCDLLKAGRAAGRRESTVVIAEGACDRAGQPITSGYVKQVLEERLGVDTRVTILGHVQRGGRPSAFDRWMSTLLGYAAVEELLAGPPDRAPQLIGLRYNRIVRAPLMKCVADTRSVADSIKTGNYDHAMALRGGSFREMTRVFTTMAQALPGHRATGRHIAILHMGGPAPGMNAAVRAAVRLALDRGYIPLAIRDGFEGLLAGRVSAFDWGSVDGWGTLGGANLGVSRKPVVDRDLARLAEAFQRHQIHGVLMIGGWAGYLAVHQLYEARKRYPALAVPMICLPASINNNLPGSEFSLGADTALNSIVDAVDKIKASAVAVQRCFVVEVMGHDCGYLALMAGIAAGAEHVYVPEHGVKLTDLESGIASMRAQFAQGQRVSLVFRSERANPLYTTAFMCALFEQESGGAFDVRSAVLGHVQQGGDPSPYDRIQAVRLAARCVDHLYQELTAGIVNASMIGIARGRVELRPMADLPALIEPALQRPREQWWLALEPIAQAMAR
jgi:6-phosphofructokinase 1